MHSLAIFAAGIATGTILWVSRAKIAAWAQRTFARNKAPVAAAVQAEAAKVEKGI